MRDFIGIVKGEGAYDEASHNMSQAIYTINHNEIEFFGLDEPQKVRGRKRKYLWMNEANEFTHEDFVQLNLRTTHQIFMDYNPSDEHHWIYDNILTRDDCAFIKSTYRDNRFLESQVIAEIERLKTEDPNYWTIYGEGEVGRRASIIYSHWTVAEGVPKGPEEMFYGLDFGFNKPTALVRLYMKETQVVAEEILYATGMTNAEFMRWMDVNIPVDKLGDIIADCEDPQRIEEIYRHTRPDGRTYNIYPAEKGAGSVQKGIDTVKSTPLAVLASSTNLLKEIKFYKWKEDKNGNVLDEPVKFNDHLMDALRYALHSRQHRFASRVLFTA
jgi:phage terminase large subunit